MNEFIGRDSCDGIELWRWWGLPRAMRLWSRPMQLLGFEPLDTLVSCKLEGEASSSYDEGSYVDKDVSIHSLSGKVEVFVGLDIESCHRSVTNYYKK
jgi:hypothetical protein